MLKIKSTENIRNVTDMAHQQEKKTNKVEGKATEAKQTKTKNKIAQASSVIKLAYPVHQRGG